MTDLSQLAKEGRINDQASLRDRQAIIINAPIAHVWSILSDISSWPDWNPRITKTIVDEVKVGSTFSWHLNRNTLLSTISAIKPMALFSFISTLGGSKSIQVWSLEKSGDTQTIVTLEMSMQGIRTIFYGHQKLNQTLLDWIERLKKKAETPTPY